MTAAEQLELLIGRASRYLPTTWTSKLGDWLGRRHARRAIRLQRLWVKRTHQTLERLANITDENEREKRIIDHIGRVGQVYAEMPIQQRLCFSDRLRLSGENHLAEISGPVILASCHLSNWELARYVAHRIGGRWVTLYLPPDTPVRDRLAREARLRWPDCELVPTDASGAMMRVERALAKGASLLIYIDEEKNGYVWSPSLGRKLPYAGNRWFAARLAIRHRLDILPVYIEPADKGCYRAVIEAPIRPPESGDDETRSCQLADRLDQRLDSWVRQWLEHWYWLPQLNLDKEPPDYSGR